MSTISSNLVMASFSSQFDYAPKRQASLNVGRPRLQGKDEDENNAFQKNLDDELKSSLLPTFVSTPTDESTSSVEDDAMWFANDTLAKVKSGQSLADAMIEAKAEAFELLFEEELAENGGDVKKAIEDARVGLGVEMSDQELLGVLHDMVQKYKDTNPELSEELGEYASKLSEKMELEAKRKMEASIDDVVESLTKTGSSAKMDSPIKADTAMQTDSSGKTNSLGILNALQQKHTDSQTKNPLMNIFHSKYLENQAVTSRYESKREALDFVM